MVDVKASGQTLWRFNAMNPTVQWPGSNSSIGKRLLFIYKCGFYRWEWKNSHRKITITHTETTHPNCIALRASKNEAGARAPVFEKSATELKQKLLKCKRTIQIAIFKVRTLNRIGQLPELTVSTIDHNIDIICIREHWYTHGEDIRYHDTGNGWTLATVSAWKNSANATTGGVGMLLGPQALKSLNSIEKIKLRMMVATFNGNPSTSIISCYSPTNVSEETDLIAFYNELSSLIRSISKHNILIIGGDMNAQIGKNVDHKFSQYNLSNRNGEHQTDFTLENRLTCLNKKFQKKRENYGPTSTQIIRLNK